MRLKTWLTALHKTLILLVSLVLLLSAVMTGTLAWHDFTQHKTNAFRGSLEKGSVLLLKHEKDNDGNPLARPVPNAQFKLYRIENGAALPIGGLYITDANGQIAIDDLPAGSYYFEETAPGYGYTYDHNAEGALVKQYAFTISGADSAVVAVQAYNRRSQGALTLTKIVKDGDRDKAFTFTVKFSDGNSYPYTVNGGEPQALVNQTLTLKHGETAVFENLPAGVEYAITEATAANYQTQSQNSHGTIPADGTAEATFTNTYKPILLMGTLSVTKLVSGDAGETDRDFHFIVKLPKGTVYTYRINGGALQTLPDDGSLTLKHNETAVFENLQLGTAYTVTETDANTDGYVTDVGTVSGTIAPTGNRVTIHNRKDEPDDPRDLLGSLTVTKTVTGDNADTEKPFTFTVTFGVDGDYPYTINGEAAGTLSNGGTITLKHGDVAVFADLPVGLAYTITEQDYTADGYTASTITQQGAIVLGSSARADFINRRDVPADKIVKLTVVKRVNGEPPLGDENKQFWFTLTINGEEPIRFTLQPNESKSFTIPADAAYTLIEDSPIADGYVQTEIINGTGTASKPETLVTVTNTYVGPVFVTISGTKTWDTSANPTAALPTEIIVHLKNGDTIVETKTITPDTDGTWRYTFVAPKYDSDGNEIVYTVAEEPIPGFTATYNGHDITNTADAPGLTSVKVTKRWLGENPDHPGSITVQLYRNGTAYGTTVTLTADNDWTYTWVSLPDNVVWTVDEIAVPADYTKSVTAVGTNDFIIYNTWNNTPGPKGEPIVIEGAKTWSHGSNPVSSHPKSITVVVKNGDYIAAQRVVTAADNWRWRFTLPKYQADGVTPIVYTIEEQNVPRYTAVYNGYNIVNYYRTPDYPGDSPPTGDETNTSLWPILLIGSTIAMATLLLIRKQKPKYKPKH